jgi:hypothetical protein
MGIVALRFYKYFAPLGLKSQLIFLQKIQQFKARHYRRAYRRSAALVSRCLYQVLATCYQSAKRDTRAGEACDTKKARGIAAEPLAYLARSGKYASDGADSPTRAC